MPPAIIDAMTAFRRQLTAGELQARAVMVRRWLQVEAALQGDVIATVERIAQMRQQGVTVRAWRVMELDRYQSLLRQSRTQITRYVDNVAGPVTATRQLQLIDLGQQHALTAHSVLGVRAQFGRLPREVIENLAGVAGDGTPLNDLLRSSYGADEADAILERMLTGVARGQNPRVIARDVIRHGYSQSLTRMMATQRTETLRVYREASRQQYLRSGVVVGYVRLADHGPRTCEGCLAADGRHYDLNESFDSHVNCLPAGAVVHAPTLEGATHRWFEGHIINIRTAAGNELAVTPNHPILTDKGWVAAHLIQAGDNVISTGNAQRMLDSIDPDNQHEPALIEQIAHTLAGSAGMISRTVPTSPINFHGEGGNGDVNIVFADSLLHGVCDTALSEPVGHHPFVIGDMGQVAFFGECAFNQFGVGSFDTANGILRIFDIASVFFGCAFGHHKAVGFGGVANIDGGFFQSHSNDGSRCVKCGSKGVFGFSGNVAGDDFITRQVDTQGIPVNAPASQVAVQGSSTDVMAFQNEFGINSGDVFLDSVVNLDSRKFSGHVYNLQTKKGWYVANNIITHNCRCTLVPRLSDDKPDWETGEEWFERQEPVTQRQILGPGKYDLWESGQVKFSDFAVTRRDATWGNAIVPATLRELTPTSL